MITIKCKDCKREEEFENFDDAVEQGWSRKQHLWVCPDCKVDNVFGSEKNEDDNINHDHYDESVIEDDDDESSSSDEGIHIGGFGGGSFGGGGGAF